MEGGGGGGAENFNFEAMKRVKSLIVSNSTREREREKCAVN
jgi:hypothetical protein